MNHFKTNLVELDKYTIFYIQILLDSKLTLTIKTSKFKKNVKPMFYDKKIISIKIKDREFPESNKK